MDRNIVFCYVSLKSTAEKSKLFMEYLLKKTLRKKHMKRESISSPYSLSAIFNIKYIMRSGGSRQLRTLDFLQLQHC